MLRINFLGDQKKFLSFIGKLGKKMKGKAYLVGGPVRDLLIGRISEDIDIVFVGNAVKLAKKFSKKVRGKIKKYKDYPNATVKWKNGKIDFVTARKETYSQIAALPDIEKADNIEEDLARRDFTMNSIAADLSPDNFGELIDPFKGVNDCNRKLIRFLHKDSFKDDPTRILRALRFMVKLEFKLEKETEKYLKKHKKYLLKLSHERLWNEMKLCLKAGSSIFDVFKKYKILEKLDLNYPSEEFIEMVDTGSIQFGIDPVKTFIIELNLKKNPEKLEFQKELKEQIKLLKKINTDNLTERSIIHDLTNLKDYALLYLFSKYPENSIIIENFIDNRANLRNIELNGKDLKKMGIEEGPEIGKVIQRIIEERWRGKITSREDEVEFVQKYIGDKNES